MLGLWAYAIQISPRSRPSLSPLFSKNVWTKPILLKEVNRAQKYVLIYYGLINKTRSVYKRNLASREGHERHSLQNLALNPIKTTGRHGNRRKTCKPSSAAACKSSHGWGTSFYLLNEKLCSTICFSQQTVAQKSAWRLNSQDIRIQQLRNQFFPFEEVSHGGFSWVCLMFGQENPVFPLPKLVHHLRRLTLWTSELNWLLSEAQVQREKGSRN